MNTTDLIHGFVDGSLNIEEENLLFDLLRSDSSIRAELKSSMIIESSMKSSVTGIAASAASTNAIFSQLGFAVPNTVADTGASASLYTKVSTGIKDIYQNYSGIIYSSLVSSVTTAVVLFFLLNNDGELANLNQEIENYRAENKGLASLQMDNNAKIQNLEHELNASYSREIALQENLDLANQENQMLSDNLDYMNRIQALRNNEGRIYSFVEDNNENSEPLAMITSNDLYADNSSRNRYAGYSFSQSVSSIDKIPEFRPLQNSRYESSTNFDEENIYLSDSEIGLSLEVFGFIQNSFQNEFVDPSYHPVFANSAIALSLEYSDSWQFSAGLRQEYFYQEYDGEKNDGKLYDYYQNTNYLSYELSARYSFYKYENLDFISQVSLGLNQAGPLGRAMLGVSYAPSSDYSILLGMESSALYFHHKEKNFFSSKYSFVYGMQFNF